MWQGSFPRPTPDGKKSSAGMLSGSLVDLSLFNSPVPPQLCVANLGTSASGIAVWNKYAAYQGNVYDISDPMNPQQITGLGSTYLSLAINDEYFYECSTVQNGYVSARNISTKSLTMVAQTSYHYYSSLKTDGESIYFSDYDNNTHMQISKASKDGSTILWTKTLDEAAYNNGTTASITIPADLTCPYFYVLYDNANGSKKLYKINKQTGQIIAKSGNMSGSLLRVDTIKDELYISENNTLNIYDGTTFALKQSVNFYTSGVTGNNASVYDAVVTNDYIYVRVYASQDFTGIIRRSNFTPIATTFKMLYSSRSLNVEQGKDGAISIREDWTTYGGQSQYQVHLQFNKLKVK